MFEFNSTHLLCAKLFEAHGGEEQVGEFSDISPIVEVRDDQNNRKVLFVISLVKGKCGGSENYLVFRRLDIKFFEESTRD